MTCRSLVELVGGHRASWGGGSGGTGRSAFGVVSETRPDPDQGRWRGMSWARTVSSAAPRGAVRDMMPASWLPPLPILTADRASRWVSEGARGVASGQHAQRMVLISDQ